MEEAILLVNLGSPRSPAVRDVAQFLCEFLTDPKVIELPFLQRQLLVRCVIVPRRVRAVAESYAQIWEGGSPLVLWGQRVAQALAQSSGRRVVLAMRYGQPGIAEAMRELRGCKVTAIPLFPQYAEATTGSIVKKLERYGCRVVPSYCDNAAMIEAMTEQAAGVNYDHLLISFHGLPMSQINKCDRYRRECMRTAEAIAAKLRPENWSVSFQSRLGKEPWLEPYTIDRVRELAQGGMKSLAVISPSFVADCLETTFEIGEECRAEFMQHGGQQFHLIPCMNDHPAWIKALAAMA